MKTSKTINSLYLDFIFILEHDKRGIVINAPSDLVASLNGDHLTDIK